MAFDSSPFTNWYCMGGYILQGCLDSEFEFADVWAQTLNPKPEVRRSDFLDIMEALS